MCTKVTLLCYSRQFVTAVTKEGAGCNFTPVDQKTGLVTYTVKCPIQAIPTGNTTCNIAIVVTRSI